MEYRRPVIFTLDEVRRLLGTRSGPVQDGFYFRMGFGPVSNHILFGTPKVAVQVTFSNTVHEIFWHTPSVSINAVSFAFGIQWEVLNFGVLILFTKIFTCFPHPHSPVFDPKEFLFDPF
jgi:high-affinity nickel permease